VFPPKPSAGILKFSKIPFLEGFSLPIVDVGVVNHLARRGRLEHPEVTQKVLVSMVERDYTTDDGIMVLGYRSFVKKLWNGELITSTMPSRI
jgi:hypothetical protein